MLRDSQETHRVLPNLRVDPRIDPHGSDILNVHQNESRLQLLSCLIDRLALM